jgi:hypothetical protein
MVRAEVVFTTALFADQPGLDVTETILVLAQELYEFVGLVFRDRIAL